MSLRDIGAQTTHKQQNTRQNSGIIEVRAYSGKHHTRNYTETDRGTRAERNGQILNENRKLSTKYARDLQAKKARLMQTRVKLPKNASSLP